MDVKSDLEKEKRDYISYEDFEDVCFANKIIREDEIKFLSKFLHDLGIIIHFQDDLILSQTIILNPKWGTKGVYSILESEIVNEQMGVFSSSQLSTLLKNSNYPRSTHAIVLNLMKRFELCYDLDISEKALVFGWFPIDKIGKKYIAPQLLDIDPPDLNTKFINPSSLRYSYEVMPPGIVTRLIVRLHSYIKDGVVWKEGVLLHWQDTTALITLDQIKKQVLIQAEGSDAKLLISIIRNNLRAIHDSFNSLIYKTEIPCPCKDCRYGAVKYYFSLEVLKKMMLRNRKELICHESGEYVSVINLLKDLEEFRRQDRVSREITIYTLYSKEDKAIKENLEVALLSLKNYGINLNDPSRILPGALRENIVQSDVEKADIVVLLLSANFISSRLFSSELVNSLIQNAKRDRVRLLPILARPCNWEDTSVNGLQLLPRNLKAISLSEHQDA
ncbi:MAG: COR domain-containing protein, partial [Cyanobacteria bacterium J06649_11]